MFAGKPGTSADQTQARKDFSGPLVRFLIYLQLVEITQFRHLTHMITPLAQSFYWISSASAIREYRLSLLKKLSHLAPGLTCGILPIAL